LRAQGQRDEENKKVVAARRHPPTRATASDKKLIAPSYSIGFGRLQLQIEADVASYATILKNTTLRTQGQRDEENTKVVAAKSHPPTRATASDKMVIAPSYSIGFGSFQLRIEADIASYTTI
jgi:hypothetical protein